MGATKVLLSAQEFDNYPFKEDKRYELDEGELIVSDRPAYSHNRAVKNLFFAAAKFIEKSRIGEVLISENVYALSNRTRRSPDLAIILGDRRQELEHAMVIPIIPELVAEVLSPSETPRMIHRKLKQYFAAGVRQVWLIDPDACEVELWNGPSLPDRALSGNDTLQSALLPGFSLPLADLFA